MITESSATSQGASYTDWGAIIAGAVVAAAIAFILITFGTALGLTISTNFEGNGWSLSGYLIAVGLWLVWVQVSSVMAGAYNCRTLTKAII